MTSYSPAGPSPSPTPSANTGNNPTDSSRDYDSTLANPGGPSTAASMVGSERPATAQYAARRPSLSSMSSASGYASSIAANVTGGNAANGSALGSRVPARHPGSLTPLSQATGTLQALSAHATGFDQAWLAQQPQANPVVNVTPWIEQQAQVAPMQNMGMGALGDAQKTRAQLTNLSMLTQARAVPMNPSSTAGSMEGMTQQSYSQYGRYSRSPQGGNNDTSMARKRASTSSKPPVSHDDEIIPTAIVIKNIPFAIKKEQLLDFMAKLGLPLPYAFNYHFDNGVFRGLAFANFNTTDETSLVVNLLNGREIGGRKLRVEYKKMLPPAERERIEREKRERRGQLEEQHRSGSQTSLASMYSIASAPPSTNNLANYSTNPRGVVSERLYVSMPPSSQLARPPPGLDMNNPEALELYTKLVLFRDEPRLSSGATAAELAFQSASVTGTQRRMLSLLTQFLGLVEVQDSGFIVIKRLGELTGVATASQQLPPSLARSHSHSILDSASALSMNTGRYRQQSPRTVSGQQPGSLAYGQAIGQSIHHSASAASLNRQSAPGGYTAPSTPNPSRLAFNGNPMAPSLAAAGFGSFGNPALNSNLMSLLGSTAQKQQMQQQQQQLQQQNAKGFDDLLVSMDNLSFDRA